MAKITHRRINDLVWINDTFLAPYCGYIAKMVEYKNGRIDLYVDGMKLPHVEGGYESTTGFKYTVKKLMGKPLKNY